MSARLRMILGVLLVLALAGAAADRVVGRILNSDMLRSAAQEAVREVLGRAVTYDGLEHSWIPLAIVVKLPRVSGRAPGDPPVAEAKDIFFGIHPLPLLWGKLAIHKASLDTPTIRVVISPEGAQVAHLIDDEEGADSGDDDAVALPGGLIPFLCPGHAPGGRLERVQVRSGAVIVEDRTREPAVTWEIRELVGEMRRASRKLPIDFEFDARLAAGSITARGQVSPAGSLEEGRMLDADLVLDGVDASLLAPYLGESWAASGRIEGRLEIEATPNRPLIVSAALDLDGGELRFQRIALRGPIALGGEWVFEEDGSHGRIVDDAEDAELSWGEGFVKRAGDTASASARVSLGAGSPLAFDDVHLRIRNAEAEGRMSFGERARVEARVPAFDLAGWDTSITELAGYRFAGPVEADLSLTTNPLDVRGSARLDGVRVGLPERGDLVVRVELVGEGETVRTRGAEFEIGGRAIPAELVFSNLADAPEYRLRFHMEDLDANQWMSTFTRIRDTIYGSLSMDADLRGPVETPLLADIEGRTRADIIDGELVGVSLLQATFERLGAVGTAASAGSRVFDLRHLFTGKHAEDLYTSKFESIGGTFDFGGGVVETHDLRFVYGNFTAELAGEIGLLDLALDMTGSLTLGEQIDQALASRLRLGSLVLGSDRTIPLAAVRGTLHEPTVEVADDWIVSLALSVAKLPVQRAVDVLRGAAELPSRRDSPDDSQP